MKSIGIWLWCFGIAFAAGTCPVLAADATNSPSVRPDAPETLAKREFEVDARCRELIHKISEVQNRLGDARDRALAQDKELKALAHEIETKQAELEQKIAAKYPDIARMAADRDGWTKEYTVLHAQLMEISRQRAAQGAAQ